MAGDAERSAAEEYFNLQPVDLWRHAGALFITAVRQRAGLIAGR
jgi:hypothetical protein